MNKNTLFWLVIAIIVVIVIGAAANASSSPRTGSASQGRTAPKYDFTITADAVGLDYITVTNENTGASIKILPQYLPITLNFAPNDILTFIVIPKTNYNFNAWKLDDGTWESDNPLAIKPSGSFSMHALFTAANATP